MSGDIFSHCGVQSGTGSFSLFDQEEYIKQLKVCQPLKMCNIVFFFVKKKQNNNNNAILALRYQKVNHGVNHQMAKKINRQPSNEQADNTCIFILQEKINEAEEVRSSSPADHIGRTYLVECKIS